MATWNATTVPFPVTWCPLSSINSPWLYISWLGGIW